MGSRGGDHVGLLCPPPSNRELTPGHVRGTPRCRLEPASEPRASPRPSAVRLAARASAAAPRSRHSVRRSLRLVLGLGACRRRRTPRNRTRSASRPPPARPGCPNHRLGPERSTWYVQMPPHLKVTGRGQRAVKRKPLSPTAARNTSAHNRVVDLEHPPDRSRVAMAPASYLGRRTRSP